MTDERTISLDRERRSARRWRRAFTVLSALLVIAGIGAVVLHFSLPSIVRWQVRNVLAKAGYPDATFRIDSASIFGARIGDVRAGKTGELSVSSAKIDYSPVAALAGRIEAVAIENATIMIDLDALTSAPATNATTSNSGFDPFATTNKQGLPVNRFDLRGCNVTLVRGAARGVVRLDGVLWRETWDGDRARISLQMRDAANTLLTLDGSVDFARRTTQVSATTRGLEIAQLLPFLSDVASEYLTEARGRTNVILNLWYAEGKSHTDGSFELVDGKFVASDDIGATLDGVNFTLKFQSFEELRGLEAQHIDVARITYGSDPPIELSNLHVEFTMPHPEQIVVNELVCEWAGGRVRTKSAAPLNPIAKSTSLTLVIERAQIEPFLQLVARGQVHGEGTISGEVPIAIEWPRVTIGTGHVRADAPGVLHFIDGVQPVAQSIAQREPALRGQEGKIIEALANFRYDELAFEFERTEDGLNIASRIAGRGKSGLTTPLDITVRYVGLEELLNAYLSAQSRVRTSGN